MLEAPTYSSCGGMANASERRVQIVFAKALGHWLPRSLAHASQNKDYIANIQKPTSETIEKCNRLRSPLCILLNHSLLVMASPIVPSCSNEPRSRRLWSARPFNEASRMSQNQAWKCQIQQETLRGKESIGMATAPFKSSPICKP